MSAFRTAPHIDREETMRRACDMLVHCIDNRVRPSLIWAPIPVLMPGERTSTEWEPGKRLWAQLPAMNAQPGHSRRVVAGWICVGGRASVHGKRGDHGNRRTADAQAGDLTGTAVLGRAQGVPVRHGNRHHRGVCRTRAEDRNQANRSGGFGRQSDRWRYWGSRRGAGRTFAGALRRMRYSQALRIGPRRKPAIRAGVGKSLELSIGATLDPKGSVPVQANAKVLFLFQTEQPFERQAVVEVEGIKVVLTARRRPFHDIADFTSLGLEPSRSASSS